MIALASQLTPSHKRRTLAQIRYASPADLLPWADPYIASLFAETWEGESAPQLAFDEVADERFSSLR